MRVNQNDPRHRFKTADDLVDDSYLTFGEEAEDDDEELNKEDEEEAIKEEPSLEEILNESKFKTEAIEYSDFNDSENLEKSEEVEVDLEEVEGKKEVIDNGMIKTLKEERRGMGGKDDFHDLKKVKNYNLKTEPENKTQRRLRGEIKNYMEKNI